MPISLNRREFVISSGIGALSLVLFPELAWTQQTTLSSFELPSLPYPPKALEPYIDEKTMQIHHGKHHATYVNKLNEALAAFPELKGRSLEYLLIHLDKLPPKSQETIRNNGGGHWNHSLFWTILTPEKQSLPDKIVTAINANFDSFENFNKAFNQAALGVFGSGWCWLILTPDKKLAITTTPNQDNPLMPTASLKGTVLFGVDVWEHAYYLNYQNKRAEYLNAIWNVINWNKIAQIF